MTTPAANVDELRPLLGDLRLRVRTDLVSVTVGNHLIVVDRPHQQPHLLGPTSTLVFEALDGTCTVEELVDDLAGAFDGERATIEADVLELARDLLARRLLVDTVTGRPEETAVLPELADPRLPGWYDVAMPIIEETSAGCYLHHRPDLCGEPIDHLNWLEPFTLAIGTFRVGVRTNDPDVDRLLRDLFAARLVDDPRAPANLSLFVGEPDEGSGHSGLHRLYEGKKRVASSLGLPYVVASLNQRLASYDPTEGAIRLPDFMAMVGRKGAALVPRMAVDIDRLRIRLRGTGLAFASGSVEVDPVDMSLVVEVLSTDTGPMLAAEHLSPAPVGEARPVDPGRHPILALGLTSAEPVEPGTLLSAEQAVFHAARPGVTPLGLPDQPRLDLLARFATLTTCFACDETAKGLVARLQTLLGD